MGDFISMFYIPVCFKSLQQASIISIKQKHICVYVYKVHQALGIMEFKKMIHSDDD